MPPTPLMRLGFSLWIRPPLCITLCERNGQTPKRPASVEPLTCRHLPSWMVRGCEASKDQLRVVGREVEAILRHAADVLRVPASFHQSGIRMADDSLKNVPDLVSQHISYEHSAAQRIALQTCNARCAYARPDE